MTDPTTTARSIGRPIKPGQTSLNIRCDGETASQFRALVEFTGHQPLGEVLRQLLRWGAPWFALVDMLHADRFDGDPEAKKAAQGLLTARVRLDEAFFALARRHPRLALAASPDGRAPEPMSREQAGEILRLVGELGGTE